jgi:cysteinyl-tRNA synthetase
MSMKYLGRTLDIHGGGLDLQFPHHENELAQSESFTDQPFARYWMHNGLLKMGHAKMAGSVGNVVNVVDLLKQHHPETVRFLLLSTHYRSPIEWSDDRLAEVKRALDGFYRFFERYERITGDSFYALAAPKTREAGDSLHGQDQFLQEVRHLHQTFLDCMDDDFNTGGAIGVLYELLTALNRFADAQKLDAGHAAPAPLAEYRESAGVLRQMCQLLGVFLDPPAKPEGDDRLVNGLMQLLIDLRAEARKAKNFAMADQIRQRLGEMGVTLEDRPGGTGWRVE